MLRPGRLVRKKGYYFGYDYGNNLAELTGRGEQLDINSVVKGLQDAYAKKQPAITAEQLKPAVEAFQKREQAVPRLPRPSTRRLLPKTRPRAISSSRRTRPRPACSRCRAASSTA